MRINIKKDPWLFEKKTIGKGFSIIAGIDEAGRGPLAGPVVSAAVILPDTFPVAGVDDSKKLTPKQRDISFQVICKKAVSIGIGLVDNIEIDRINILQAALQSMAESVENLETRPDYLLIDGTHNISTELPQTTIIKGDSLSISISAASIIAKVVRDRIMVKYHEDYPQFGFFQHKGYPTKAHKEAIKAYGPCSIHRRSFKGVKEFL